METAPRPPAQHEQPPMPNFLDTYGDREVTLFGITGSVRDLADMCPVNLHDPRVSVNAINGFVVKTLNEAGQQIDAQHEVAFTEILAAKSIERKFTVAPPPTVKTVEMPDNIALPLPTSQPAAVHRPVVRTFETVETNLGELAEQLKTEADAPLTEQMSKIEPEHRVAALHVVAELPLIIDRQPPIALYERTLSVPVLAPPVSAEPRDEVTADIQQPIADMPSFTPTPPVPLTEIAAAPTTEEPSVISEQYTPVAINHHDALPHELATPVSSEEQELAAFVALFAALPHIDQTESVEITEENTSDALPDIDDTSEQDEQPKPQLFLAHVTARLVALPAAEQPAVITTLRALYSETCRAADTIELFDETTGSTIEQLADTAAARELCKQLIEQLDLVANEATIEMLVHALIRQSTTAAQPADFGSVVAADLEHDGTREAKQRLQSDYPLHILSENLHRLLGTLTLRYSLCEQSFSAAA